MIASGGVDGVALKEEDVFLSERKVGPAPLPLPPQESSRSAVFAKRPKASASCIPCVPCTCHITIGCYFLCILVALRQQVLSAEVWLKMSN